MIETLENTLAGLVARYLDTAESVAAGVPEIPILVADGGQDRALPCLIVGGEVREATTARRAVIVTLHLHERLGMAEGQTTRVVGAGWMRACEARLRDDEAWYSWLADEAEEVRTGYRILHRMIVPAEPIERDQAGDVVMRLALGFVCWV
ncbi:MAG: hypothetical protein QE274_00155 [Verrucomicrobiaceae bacterium]|nr:hypothetical protein [Verrucomicrobiaceae bacterium]